jgi:serine/threonine-protein kinase HipA
VTACRICLEPTDTDAPHEACARTLYGADREPALDLDLARLHTFALAMVGRTTLSGVQRKVSLGLATDRMTLRVAAEGLQFILKPPSDVFPHLPENEHLTMRLAALCGLDVPPCGLIRLADGPLAYIVRRFDRTPDGRKRRQEDVCQLAVRPPKDKYNGSAELCVRIVRRYASEPGVALLRLYRLLLFGWWTGNGDMHLKNFSLLADDEGLHHLAPAYDQLCTRLLIPDDRLALPVGGRNDNLTRRNWLDLAGYAGVPWGVAERVLRELAGVLQPALVLVERSALPASMQSAYTELLTARAAVLAAQRS